ncbi:MAG TPA: DUF2069 domain-containing protein [Steroidobacteraceae bacterium]|jgi:uncharacterized membrane protein|nr:DUF2069 domain-containing protein [Steroidobacteraceae bacterium]
MSDRARVTRRVAIVTWLGLIASVAIWPLPVAGIGTVAALIAGLPLLLPLPGLARASRRAFRAAPMALAPALALSITECLVNPAARIAAVATLTLAFAAFASLLAALRALPPD